MFVDESGDHTYKKLDDDWHRHLALMGVWFHRRDAYFEFADGLVELKRDVFRLDPDEKLVLHASEIKGRKGRFGVLRDESIDRRFCAEVLSLVRRSRFTSAMAIIDKAGHRERYAEPLHPYHYAMTSLAERYAYWLLENGSCGDAVAESRGTNEDQQLAAVFRAVASSGTRFLKPSQAKRAFTSKSLKLHRKDEDVAGLQLADILALPLKRAFLVQSGRCRAAAGRGGFARELAAVAMTKFRGFSQGEVAGRGLVWL